MSIGQGCLVGEGRAVIPPNLRKKTLEDLHDVHPGVPRMKAVEFSYVWWPGMGRDIDKLLFLTAKRAKFKLIKKYLRKLPLTIGKKQTTRGSDFIQTMQTHFKEKCL